MASYGDVLAEVFNGINAETWEWLQAHHGDCANCKQTQVVLLAYIAWKLEEIERKTGGPPG